MKRLDQYICEEKEALEAAKFIMQFYSKGRHQINESQAAHMMMEVYSMTKIHFMPTQQDVYKYMNILDTNQDGKVTLSDLGSVAIKYLCGNNNSFGTSRKSFATITTQQEEYTPSKSIHTINSSRFKNSPRKYSSFDIRKLFKAYQNGIDQRVSNRTAGQLLTRTFELVGKNGFYPTKQDIEDWIDLCDSDGDRRLSFQDYQQFVFNLFQRENIELIP